MDPTTNVVTNGRWFCVLFVVINLTIWRGDAIPQNDLAMGTAILFACLPGAAAIGEQVPYGIRLPVSWSIYGMGIVGVILTAMAGLN